MPLHKKVTRTRAAGAGVRTFRPYRVEGVLAGQRRLIANHVTFDSETGGWGTAGSQRRLSGDARSIQILRHGPRKGPYRVHQYLCNAPFLSPEGSVYRSAGGGQHHVSDRLTFVADGVDATLRLFNSSAGVARRLAASRGFEVTTRMETDLARIVDLPSHRQLGVHVAGLLSIAMGRRVSIAGWSLLTQKGTPLIEHFQQPIAGPFMRHAQLIDYQVDELGIGKYLTATVGSMAALAKTHQLEPFLDYYIAAIESGGLNRNLLLVVTALESLTHQLILKSTHQYVALTTQQLDGITLDAKLSRIRSQHPFVTKARWKRLRKDLRPAIRNPLIHRGVVDLADFVSAVGACRDLLMLAARLFLKTLGFRGRIRNLARGRSPTWVR